MSNRKLTPELKAEARRVFPDGCYGFTPITSEGVDFARKLVDLGYVDQFCDPHVFPEQLAELGAWDDE
ncbi:MAG: hypothetical protein A2139_02900 [Desulfobacca sp. RBG_16_60_12]|nr:MAG: hypothetical protein A2139_02900 [Desulfobacca sp. RBG_16_60_12]